MRSLQADKVKSQTLPLRRAHREEILRRFFCIRKKTEKTLILKNFDCNW